MQTMVLESSLPGELGRLQCLVWSDAGVHAEGQSSVLSEQFLLRQEPAALTLTLLRCICVHTYLYGYSVY